jgi:antibiotic biosynthesis monooxygenase (ABM) superfamily enzyme
MIARIWHGYTTIENADAYETLLKEEVFVSIESQLATGYRGIHLLRRTLGNEVEFTTIMWFTDMEAVKKFAGENYQIAHVPAKAQAILSRFDETSIHCEMRHFLEYGNQ